MEAKIKDWKEIVKDSSFNRSELEIIKNLRAEYKKLFKGFSSDLGRWLVDKCWVHDTLKNYMPEINTAASLSIAENYNSKDQSNKMFATIADEFKKNLEKYYDKE